MVKNYSLFFFRVYKMTKTSTSFTYPVAELHSRPIYSYILLTVTWVSETVSTVEKEEWQWQRKVVKTVQEHVSYAFLWIRRKCDYV